MGTLFLREHCENWQKESKISGPNRPRILASCCSGSPRSTRLATKGENTPYSLKLQVKRKSST